MPIEDTLERLATANESIAKSLELLVNSAAGIRPITKDAVSKESAEIGSLAKTELVEAPKTRPGKKIEEKKAETTGDSFYPDDENNDEPEIKWPDVNKKLFSMLEQVRDTKGADVAKATCAALMKEYSGGQKFGPGTVKPSSYKALLDDIEAELEALNG